MMASHAPEHDRENRFHELLLEYVEAIERGEAPDRQQILDAHPEYAQELAEFFAARDQLDRIAAPLRTAAGAGSRVGSDSGVRRSTATRPASEVEIGRVGDFRLLREVGRGGMGVVYEAEQVSLRRRVALKILPFAAAVDPRHLQRFRNEAQAAAYLHHSNIVPVYAVGAEGGVHYYAMQFIDGQSLAQLLAGLRDAESGSVSDRPFPGDSSSDAPVRESFGTTVLVGRPTDRTPPGTAISTEHSTRRRSYFRRVADLVRQGADALEYAHQVGVIHRDVKPANLLLDVSGRLWVTDFGLALIRNDAGLTATGELLGTLRYMSPEQALGRPGLVDHRTDIYALGVTLYELLTLRPIFDSEDRHALLRRLAEDDPPFPRTVDPAIPPELETIVLKAIAKAPADRYSSARELADDLQRFLEDRPIQARRPTLLDRGTKFVRRHRVAALAAVVVLLLASIGLGVSTAIIAREHAETKAAYDREREANERERARAREAEDHYQRTRRAVDLFVELSDEGLLDFPPLAPLRQRLLEAAVAYYQELSGHREDAAVRKDLEESRARLTKLQNELTAINEIHAVLLLDQPAVATHLELTANQVSRLTPALDRLKRQQRIGSPGSPGREDLREPGGGAEKRRQIAELAATGRAEVEGILTAAQYRQLRQVYLQLPGPHVFGPAVLDALGLTDAQKGQARQIQAEAAQASLKLFATAERRDEAFTEVADVWTKAKDRIVSTFTPAQKERWAEMTGPPIQGEIRMPLPHAGRPPAPELLPVKEPATDLE